MLSKIAGLLKGEMSRAASMFVSAQSKFLSLLEAYKEKVPDDSVPEAAETEPGPVAEAEPVAEAVAGATEEEAPAVEAEEETPASETTGDVPEAEIATTTEEQGEE